VPPGPGRRARLRRARSGAAAQQWLEWELWEHPLPASVDLDRLERIARTADVGDQRALFRETDASARAGGQGATIDGWEPDAAWLRGEV
jgi:hypothetical protein